MGFLALIVFLLRVEVTLQFDNIPWDERESTNDYNYLRCTVRTIAKLQGATTMNLRFYTNNDSSNGASRVVQSLFDGKRPITLVISEPHQLDPGRIVHEKICLAVVNNDASLRQVLEMLHREIYHENCIIDVKFRFANGVYELARILENIWTSGVPRNIIFIFSNFDTEGVSIIGVPAYSRGNCLRTTLVEVGQYRNGKFLVNEAGLYPRSNDLGGCELSVMIQPPMLPYIERMDNSPGGLIGDLMIMMGESMNFTPVYVWSVRYEDMIDHLYSRDLNLIVDMMPRATIPITDFRFSVGVVGVAFIVPQRNKRKIWKNLLAPMDRSIWFLIAIILGSIAILSSISKGRDSGNVALKILGTLLGVGVGRIISESGWTRIFLWFWLLPAYVLIQCYLAHLTKDIAVPIFIPEIQTLYDLAHSELDIICVNSTRRGVCNVPEESFQLLCKKCRTVSDVDVWTDFYPNLMRSGQMNDTSAIANYEFLAAHPAFLNVHIVEDKVAEVNQFFEARPGSSWIFEMKGIWDRIFASGLVHYWRRRYIDIKRRKAEADSIEAFRPEFGWYSFVLLLAGWAISFGCLIIELIIYRFIDQIRELVR